MSSISEIRYLRRLVAELLLSHRWKVWSWGDSAGLEGLLAASEILNDSKYEAYVYGFFKGWSARQDDTRKFDHTATGLVLVDTYEKTGDPVLLEAAEKLAEYLSGFQRLADGCPIHYEDAALELPPELPEDHPDYDPLREAHRKELKVQNGGACVFVDSVHFQTPFFSKLWALSNRSEYLDEAIRTLTGQVNRIWDSDPSLFHHFWVEKTEEANGVFWGRGQGWGMFGILETLSQLLPRHELKDIFLPVLAAQAQRLSELQDESGHWHTVVDEPDTCLESSVAAFVVHGFSEGMLQDFISLDFLPVVERAWNALRQEVDASGLVANVSFETFPSLTKEHYKSMRKEPWFPGDKVLFYPPPAVI